MTGERHPGEGIVDALRMYTEDADEEFTLGHFALDLQEVIDLVAYVESLEVQINSHPPMEVDPDA